MTIKVMPAPISSLQIRTQHRAPTRSGLIPLASRASGTIGDETLQAAHKSSIAALHPLPLRLQDSPPGDRDCLELRVPLRQRHRLVRGEQRVNGFETAT